MLLIDLVIAVDVWFNLKCNRKTDKLIRKGRKPTPQSEEERLQQEKKKEESQLRKAANRNAAKRAKQERKFNMGPVLGHAKELTDKSVTNNQERQLKKQAQWSSHKTQPRYNTKSSSSAVY